MCPSRRWLSLSLSLALGFLAAGTACHRPGVATVSVDEPDTGVPTVVVSAESLAAAPRLVLTEETRIGGGSAAGTQFSNIAGIALSTRGEIFVADAVATEVCVFDERGRLVRRFSRPGQGPGEMQSPRAVTMGGDTLFVMDRNGVNRFAPEGKFLGRGATAGTALVPSGGGTPGTLFYQRLTYTTRGLVTSLPQSYGTSHRDRAPYRDTLGLHVLSPLNGHLMTAFATVVSPDRLWIADATFESEIGGPATMPWYRSPWFAPNQLDYTAAPDGHVYIARRDGVSIDVLSLRIPPVATDGAAATWRDGAAPARIRLGVPRRPGTDADFEQAFTRAVAEQRRALRVVQNPPDLASHFDVWRKMSRLEYLPVVGKLLASETGDLLVQRADLSTGTEFYPGPTTWDLLGPDGHVRGQVELPSLFTPILLRDEHLLGVQRDSLNVPSVVQYRLQRVRIEPPVTLQTPTTR